MYFFNTEDSSGVIVEHRFCGATSPGSCQVVRSVVIKMYTMVVMVEHRWWRAESPGSCPQCRNGIASVLRRSESRLW